MKNSKNIFLEAFFSSLQKEAIRYCILRNADEIRLGDAHDVDMSLDVVRLEDAKHCLFRTAESLGWRLHFAAGSFRNKYHFKPMHFFHVGEEGEVDIVHFDFCPTFAWNGYVVVPNEILMQDIDETDLYHTVHPAAEAVIDFFIRLLYNGYIKDKYKERIHTYFREYPVRVRKILLKILSENNAEQLMRYIEEQNWAAAAEMRSSFIQDLKKNAYCYKWHLLFHKVAKAVRYPGVMVAIEGTDGSGKSTVIDGLRNVMKNTFPEDMITYYHWRPNVVFRQEQKNDGGACPTPHNQIPRGRFMSLLKVCACVADYVWGYWRYIRISLGMGHMVVFDRYYYDFYLDKIRYRLNISDVWIRLLQAFVPSPDVTLVLTGEAEPIWQRKKEMSLKEVQEQISSLKNYQRLFAGAVAIDVVRPIPQVVHSAAVAILEAMAAHCAYRRKA